MKNNLRIIKTARTEEAINEAALLGFWPLVKPVIPSPLIKSKYSIIQNLSNGTIEVVNDFRGQHVNDDTKVVIDFTYYYPHHFPSPFAAYLIPKDLIAGERVYIEDLIEDIVETNWNQGDSFRLQSCEAIWDGAELIIQFKDRNSIEIIG
jgi:hypothetical protein